MNGDGTGSILAAGGLLLLLLFSCAGTRPAQPVKPTPEPTPTEAFAAATPGPDYTVIRADGFHGRCPVCEASRIVSRVAQGWCTTTLLGTSAWYDSAGNFHFRDPNTTTCEHRCSEDHWFQVIYAGVEELVLRPDGTRIR
jgi:hypothetical protein